MEAVKQSAIEHLDDSGMEKRTGPNSESSIELNRAEQKALYWKMDYHILPALSTMYLIQYMDRGNIGNARIQGLQSQLNLTSRQYSNILTVFYLSYAAFEVPSNLLLRVLPPRIYLPLLMLLWGTIMLASGFCKTYHSQLAMRFLLGFFEAGFYPGITFYLSTFYPRNRFGMRVGVFYVAATLAGSFSGLLAFAFAHLAGKANLLGWSYIFIGEGCITMLVAIIAFFFIWDSPSTSSWLTATEKAYLAQEMSLDRGLSGAAAEDNTVSATHVLQIIKDWQAIPLALTNFLTVLSVNALSQFLPSIINGMGYTALNAQLLTIPVFASAVPFIYFACLFSDRTQKRIPYILAGQVLALIGWALLAATKPSLLGVRLFACFLIGIGEYSGFAPGSALYASNFSGRSKRAVGLALINGASAASGIISSNAFRTQDAPRFKPGCYTAMACSALAIVIYGSLYFIYGRINIRREKLCADNDGVLSDEEIIKLGDKAPMYRYSQ